MREYRFAIGDPTGERSTVWKIWVNKNDVYILTRMMGSDAKVSLHESGLCQWSLNFESIKGNQNIDLVHNRNRHIVRWNMAKLHEGQANHIFRIVIPHSELKKNNKEEDLKKVNWIPAPSVGSALQIECYITPPLSEEPKNFNVPYKHLTTLRLADGRWFVVFAQEIKINQNKLTIIENAKKEIINIALERDIVVRDLHATGFLDMGECKGLIELKVENLL